MFVKKLVVAVAVGVGVLGSAGLGWYGWAAVRADDKAAKTDKDKAAKSDKDQLQGKWKITSAVVHGRQLPLERAVAFVGDAAVFNGDKLKLAQEMAFTLDSSKSPKWITLSAGDGKKFAGVYEMDGDKLTLHYDGQGSKSRPTELEFKRGMTTTHLVLERVK